MRTKKLTVCLGEINPLNSEYSAVSSLLKTDILTSYLSMLFKFMCKVANNSHRQSSWIFFNFVVSWVKHCFQFQDESKAEKGTSCPHSLVFTTSVGRKSDQNYPSCGLTRGVFSICCMFTYSKLKISDVTENKVPQCQVKSRCWPQVVSSKWKILKWINKIKD